MRDNGKRAGPKIAAARSAVALCLVPLLLLTTVTSQAQELAGPKLSVFEFPRIAEGQRSVLALVQLGEFARAEAQLDRLITQYPSLPPLHYQKTILLLRQDRRAAAMQSLRDAVERGLPASVLENSRALDALRAEPTFDTLLEAVDPKDSAPSNAATFPQPTLPKSGVGRVSAHNTGWDPRLGVLRSLFRFEQPSQQADVAARDIPWSDQLNTWFREGTAAGNYGDLYDNRDRGHSTLRRAPFPQLTHVQYDKAAQEAGVDRNFNQFILYNTITIGNASLAITDGPMWRSLPREALTSPVKVARLFQQYLANHIYVYPAHRDYGSPRGDLFPANTPYMLISRGSSGSDQPLLNAVASILAALRPEVKAFLRERGLISPTVQWIFRRGQFGIESDEDYLSGRAHPTAFDAKRLNVFDMIQRAHALGADEVPQMVRLRVSEESHGEPGVQIMLQDSNETLFDTPSSVARVIRSTLYEKRLVVDASKTTDPNGRALTFRWSVLRGDKTRITVRLLNKQGSLAEIIIPWDAGAQPIDQSNITGNRVEIGVFASNGKNWSAPGFISVLFPRNEKRLYRADKKIAEIDYNDPRYQQRYVDPVLFPVRDWRDTYDYDKSGRLFGWTRFRDSKTSRFARDGSLVIDSDKLGRPMRAERVRYELERLPDGRLQVLEVPTGSFVTYSYKDDTDYLGVIGEAGGG